jgi:hypothetical protein
LIIHKSDKPKKGQQTNWEASVRRPSNDNRKEVTLSS